MPFSTTAENPLNESHRVKIKKALAALEDALANCKSCQNIGMDTQDQEQRINDGAEWAVKILKEYFGE